MEAKTQFTHLLSLSLNAIIASLAIVMLCEWGGAAVMLSTNPRQLLPMNPTTAVLLIALAISMSFPLASKRCSTCSGIFSGAVIIWTAAKLIDLVFDLSVGVDTILFSSELQFNGATYEMAPLTTLSLFLLAVALWLLHYGGTVLYAWWFPGLILVPFGLTALALVGYALQIPELFTQSGQKPMSLFTATAILMLCVSFLVRTPQVLHTLRGRFIWRVYAGHVLLVIFTAAVIGFLVDGHHRRGEAIEEMQSLRIQAELLAASRAHGAPLTETDVGVLRLMAERSDTELSIFGRDGAVLFTTAGETPKLEEFLWDPLGEVAGTVETVTPKAASDTALSAIHVTVPIVNNGEIIGFARSGLSSNVYSGRLYDLRSFAVSGGGLGVLVALLLGLFFARRVTTPLALMTEWAAEFANGVRPWTLHVKTNDEIGRLARSFDLLGTQLELRVRQLQEALADAKRANQAKTIFLASMSHEIRTPLNGVVGLTELLRRTPLSPQQKHYVKLARSSAEVLSALIDNILDFSKIEAEKMELQLRVFDLRELIEGTVESLASRALQKNVDLIAAIAPAIPEQLIGDSYRFRQILLNLVSNAVKFTEHGDVVVRVDGSEMSQKVWKLRVSVNDTGRGIHADLLQGIFRPFVQAHSSVSSTTGGSGLGLAICEKLVTLMGGSIGVNSEFGKGAEFGVDLAFEEGEVSATHEGSAVPLQDARILIVDGNAHQRAVLAEQLAHLGAATSSASQGVLALESLRAAASRGERYTLVMVEQRLTDMTASAFAAAMREEIGIRETPLLLLAEYDYGAEDASLESSVFVATLRKPIRQTQVAQTVVSAISGSSVAPEGESPTKDIAAVEPGTGLAHILVVEDNSINQIVASELIRAEGFQCSVVANGFEALEVTAREAFDLVVMDCQMPVMDGFEATRRIRERETTEGSDFFGEHLPIIALTANALRGDEERCLVHGMDAYVPKPIEPEILIRTIHDVLNRDAGIAAMISPELADEEDILPFVPERVLERYSKNRKLVLMLIEKFPIELSPALDRLMEASRGEECDAVRFAAHKLRGIAGVFPAHRLCALTEYLEARCESLSKAERAKLVDSIREEAIRCVEFLPDALEILASEDQADERTDASQ
ncbi:MAG: response regulator [Deltaproteobacteria bacterium]|nr:response regulator [Deltaproteobacteria bacterium]